MNVIVLKDLLEKQAAPSTAVSDVDDAAGDAEPQKRYLILISTVMTWGFTKPLDPVSPLHVTL